MSAIAPPEKPPVKTRDIDIPADLVPHFEAAVRRQGISVGVTYHDEDGSRTYHVDRDDWDEQSVIVAAEEGIERLKATLTGS
jgi:hypothetical protein